MKLFIKFKFSLPASVRFKHWRSLKEREDLINSMQFLPNALSATLIDKQSAEVALQRHDGWTVASEVLEAVIAKSWVKNWPNVAKMCVQIGSVLKAASVLSSNKLLISRVFGKVVPLVLRVLLSEPVSNLAGRIRLKGVSLLP